MQDVVDVAASYLRSRAPSLHYGADLEVHSERSIVALISLPDPVQGYAVFEPKAKVIFNLSKLDLLESGEGFIGVHLDTADTQVTFYLHPLDMVKEGAVPQDAARKDPALAPGLNIAKALVSLTDLAAGFAN